MRWCLAGTHFWGGDDCDHLSIRTCLAEDLPALCVHLEYRLRLRRRLRSTNLLERSLEEAKRRTKVIRRCPEETSSRSLCWVLDLFIASARGLALLRPSIGGRRRHNPSQADTSTRPTTPRPRWRASSMTAGFDPMRPGGVAASGRIEVGGDLHAAGGLNVRLLHKEAASLLIAPK